MVVIGALVGVAVILVFMSRFLSGRTQVQWTKEDPRYAAQVADRIRPAGRVALPGDDPGVEPVAGPVAASAVAPVATRLTGEQVYNAACFACHGAGIGGAPKLGDSSQWKPRIAQGTAQLHQHALAGYQGKVGFMPPKGGRVDLSDAEILGAVDFMVSKAN